MLGESYMKTYISAMAALLSTTALITIAPDAEAQTEDEIIVTATRRAESIQDVPIAVTAISPEVLEQQGVVNIQNLTSVAPSFSTSQAQTASGTVVLRIRGVGTTSNNIGFESAVGIFVDGAYQSRPGVALGEFVDVERVETLIGPQGTLYGAGTLGGAIRYITKKPILDEAYTELYGQLISIKESNDTGHELGFVFNQPIISNILAIRTAFNYLNNPGFIDNRYLIQEPGVSLPDPDVTDPQAISENLTTANDFNTEEVLTGRLSLKYQANDNVEFNLAYHYQKAEYGGRSLSHFNSLSSDNPIADDIGRYDSAYRYLEPRKNKNSLISLEV